ncbi:MAG: helix-turn-helix domain-containing protein [Chitinophagales bacterium]|nr:helix-turn-helix domain-containing protein [Chitinophagales bacterium]
MHLLYSLKYVDTSLYKAENIHEADDLITKETPKIATGKGATYEISLQLFKSGKTIEQIAEERSMAVSTIEGHLTKWVAQGKIDIMQVMDKDRYKQIEPYLKDHKEIALSPIKEQIPFECSFGELRMVLAHLQFINKKS